MTENGNEKIVVLDGARTPIGKFQGAYKDVPAHELGGQAVVEALRRSGVTHDDIDEVVMGQVGQVGPDAFNARRVALAAGFPTRTPAYNVNRLCGSGPRRSGPPRCSSGGATSTPSSPAATSP